MRSTTEVMEELKARFDLEDDILRRTANKLARTLTEEDDLKAEVEKLTYSKVVQAYTDSRVTQAKEKWDRDLKEGVPKNGDNDDTGTTRPETAEEGGKPNSSPTQAKQKEDPIMAELRQLRKEVQAMKAEKVTTSRATEIQALTKDLPKSIQTAYRYIDLNGLTDEAYTELKESITANVGEVSSALEEMKTASRGTFGIPPKGNGSAGTKDKPAESEVSDIVDQWLKK